MSHLTRTFLTILSISDDDQYHYIKKEKDIIWFEYLSFYKMTRSTNL